MSEPALPVIDLSPLGGGPVPRSTAVALDEACGDLGFFMIEGHGIAPGTSGAMFDAARALFAMGPESKAALDIAHSPCHRGYVGMERETLGADEPPDLKEAFELSVDLGPDHPDVLAGIPLCGPNQWPPLEGFRETVEAYFAESLKAAALVARGLAAALGLPDDFFAARIGPTVTNLRLLHYPPRSSGAVAPTPPAQPGCGEHTDYGMVTLLAVDGVSGLQVRSRTGEWIDVEVAEGQLVVNLGDMLARWTDDRWASTPHRVVAPESDHRYSIPFFVNPRFDTSIEPIATADRLASRRYEPVTAGEYLMSRFDATHAYRSDHPGRGGRGTG